MAINVDWSTAHPGAQLPFIMDGKARHTAFVGGLGSGKSWSGATKTILYLVGNPGALVLVCAPTYRQLRDSTMREFFKLLPKEMIRNFNKSEYELQLVNGSEVLFRSLENYESVRGVEVAFIWIDEANLVSVKAWRVALGRLRQPGFPHRSCITTTPRGRTGNWVFEEYVAKLADDPKLAASRATYHARTRDNIENVGEEYIADLESSYTGDFALQELMGEFVDIIEGRVYEEFSREYHVGYYGEDIFFNPSFPLYGFWDYGIGDATALWLAQTIPLPEHESIPYPDPENPKGPWKVRTVPAGSGLLLVDLLMEDGENVDYWIETVELIEKEWGPFTRHYGDPAGEQRTVTTGRSFAQHLREAGIVVRSKKLPNDQGRTLIKKLLVERRLFIADECQVGISAFTNYHWPLDADGNRKSGSQHPVHDWSSNPMDALRYGVTNLIPIFAPSPLDPRNFTQVGRSASTPSRAPRSSFVGLKSERW